MTTSQSAACARCNKKACSAVVIVPAVPDSAKRFEHQKQCLEMVCPACHRFFSIPFGSIEYREVTDEQLSLGYMSGQFTDPARLQ